MKHPTSNGSSKVQQDLGQEADMRRIVERQRRSGVYATGRQSAAPRQPIFGDFTGIDFQAQMNQVLRVRDQFMSLKPSIRRRFMDSPAALVSWVSNPDNRSEALKLGLVVPTAEEVEAMEDAAKAAAARARSQSRQLDLVDESEEGFDEENPSKSDPESQPEFKQKKPPKKGAK